MQSAAEPANRMIWFRHSSSTAMNVATNSLRLRLPRNSSKNRVMPFLFSRYTNSLAFRSTGYGSRLTISSKARSGGVSA